jgi:hypothetical protein
MSLRNAISRHAASRRAALALAVLLATGGIASAAEVVDARKPERHSAFSVQNSARGATMPIEEKRLGRDLVARIDDRLQSVGTTQIGDATVRITRADASLFIEGAFATPAIASTQPAVRHVARDRAWNDLVELKYVAPNARKSYRVHIEGDVDGRTFSVTSEVDFRGNERRQLLDRAIAQAVDEAVQEINPAAQPAGQG